MSLDFSRPGLGPASTAATQSGRVRLLYVNVIEENRGWGAEFFMNQELRRLGYVTETVDYRRNRWRLARSFLEAGDFDALLLQRGDYFPLALVASIRRPRFFWATELVERRRDQWHLLRSGLFDHIFVRTPRCRSIITSRGWIDEQRVSVLLSASHMELHAPRNGPPPDLDVLFVGTLTPHRRALLKELGRHVRVEVRQAFGRDMVSLFNRARIVLNLHAEDRLDTETRVYEALGCKAFVISEPLSDESPFRSGEHLVETEAGDAMAEAVSFYLHHEEQRRRIAEQGHHEVLEKHSYAARARTIMQVIERYLGPQASGSPSIDRAAVQRFRLRAPADHAWRFSGKATDKFRALLHRSTRSLPALLGS